MLRPICFILFYFILFLFGSFAMPGLPVLSARTPGSPTPEPPPRPIAEQLQEAQRAVEEAQTTLKRMQSAEVADALSAAGLPATMHSELVGAASHGLRHSQRYLENLHALERAKKNAETRQALTDGNEDVLLRSDNMESALICDRLNATQQALEAATNEVKILTDSTQEAVNSLPKLEQTIRQLSQNSSDIWQVTLARLKKKEVEALVLSHVVRKQVLALRITALEEDAASDKKLLQADATAAQSAESALARLDKERAEIKRQLQAANKRDQTVQTLLDKTRESYLKSRNGGDAEVATARQKYELAQIEADTTEEIIESGRIYLQILETEMVHWKYIAKLDKHISAEEMQKGTDMLNRQLELIQKWKPQLEREVRSKRMTIEGLKRRMTEGKLPETERVFLNNKLKLLQEQNSAQQRLLWRVETLHWRLLDWSGQLKKMAPSPALRTSFKAMGSGIWSTFSGIINYEICHFKETRMIAGNQVVVEEHSITIARIVMALVFFLVGYFLLTKLAQFSVRTARVRFQLPVARTALLEKCILYLMTIVLILCTLGWARIPLTIFAYLGGALAIGVGFGAQNLINNFISGIILLFERQINVGDIVEVDGHIGEVTTLGNRCSRMRRGDGVEMLVPNSFLLEKNVLNWTLTDQEHRFELKFSVAYGSPIEKVIQLVLRAFSETPNILTKPIPYVFFEQFGDNGLIFGVYYWVNLYKGLDPRQIGSNLHTRINQLFQTEGIQMPLPQQDVHLDASHPLRVQVEESTF